MLGLLYFLDSTVMVQSDSFTVLLSYLIFIEASFLFSGNEISKVQKREKLSQTVSKSTPIILRCFVSGINRANIFVNCLNQYSLFLKLPMVSLFLSPL